jgi:hypothetical protein
MWGSAGGRMKVPRSDVSYPNVSPRLLLTRPTFLYQSKLKTLDSNSPIHLIRREFRVLQRLNQGALECAPHRCTSLFRHAPVLLRERRWRTVRQ